MARPARGPSSQHTLLVPPSQIVLGESLGQGGAGSVVAAHDAATGRSLAVKFLLDGRANPKALARFRNEARIGALLEHPNICPSYGMGYQGEQPFLVMKHVRGRSLAEVIQALQSESRAEARSFPLARRLEIFCHLAQGVAYAHSRGVLHRDLKPGNVMVGDHGEVLIMDWGLAKVIGEQDANALGGLERGLTQTGAIVGTPAYMPPELLAGQTDAAGFATDTYGLGVILFELIGLERPRDGTLFELVAQSQEPLALSAVWPEAPLELERICLRALAAEPQDRYPSVAELLADVQAYRQAPPVRPTPPPPLGPKLAAAVLVSAAVGLVLGLGLGRLRAPAPAPAVAATAPFPTEPLAAAAQASAGIAEIVLLQRAPEGTVRSEGLIMDRVHVLRDEVLNALRTAVEAAPSLRLELLLEEGRLHLELHDHSEVRRCADEVLASHPDHLAAWQLKGASFLAEAMTLMLDPELDWLEFMEQARGCYQQVERLDGDPGLEFELWDLLARGDGDGFAQQLPKLADELPNPAWPFAQAAWAAREGSRSNTQTMIEHLSNAFMVHPRHPPTLITAGWHATQVNNARDALSYLDAAARSLPSSAPAWATVQFLRGQAWEHLNRPPEALEAYSRMLEARPDSVVGLTKRGALRGQTGDQEASTRDLLQASQAQPKSAWAYVNRAQAFLLLGDPVAMESDTQHALDSGELHDDQTVEATMWLGVALQMQERHREALSAFDRLVELRPGLPDAHRGRGNALERLGDQGGAGLAFEESLRLEPGQPGAEAVRSVVLQLLGRPSKY